MEANYLFKVNMGNLGRIYGLPTFNDVEYL
jgi:hypothetical protein